ncbi:MAG: hypothetical protein U5O39_17185 [Gammaproteobacteria bacterium]|nr:hypothetical protein [Gammaproteobacteria bacterium]
MAAIEVILFHLGGVLIELPPMVSMMAARARRPQGGIAPYSDRSRGYDRFPLIS